jgi:putative transposase
MPNPNPFPKDFFKQFKSKEEFNGFFTDLFKQGIQEMLQGELDEHLGYQKHSTNGYNSGNSRNGSYKKTITSEAVGDLVLNIPRDRNATFEPKVIPKGEKMSEKIEDAIIGMYSRGMTTSDITEQVLEVYGTSISTTTVSNITNRILQSVEEWQNRPLESVYFAAWMDGIRIKIKHDNRYKNMCIYIVIGLRNDGHKEVLGMWIEENESAAFWLKVLNDLKTRGVEDILIACTDNLTGFTKAIQACFPNTLTQLCIVHQIRNSCKFVGWKERKEFCADLKLIYTAIDVERAKKALDDFDAKWGAKFQYAVKSWYENWENLTPFFDFPQEIRKIIYTTNTIENLNRGIRKYTKTKSLFVDENSAKKAVFLAIQNIEKKWSVPIRNWGIVLNQFLIIFDSRCRL